LDAPGLRADYYLNLLSWSAADVVSIALHRKVFLYHPSSGLVEIGARIPRVDVENGPPDASQYISAVSWSPNGKYLTVGTSSGCLQIWDSETSQLVRTIRNQATLDEHGMPVRIGSLGWAGNCSPLVASGSRSGALICHDVRIRNAMVHMSPRGHEQEICGLAWRHSKGSTDHSGLVLASGGNDNLVRLWDLRMGLRVSRAEYTAHGSAVKAISWSPWQPNLLATGGGTLDRQICVWNTLTDSNIAKADTGAQVTALVWSPHGPFHEIIATHGFPDPRISIWSFPKLRQIGEIKGSGSRFLGAALGPDNSRIVTISSDEKLQFWRCFENKTPKVETADGELSFRGRSDFVEADHLRQLRISKNPLPAGVCSYGRNVTIR
jgi:cell division cycle protein 20 (cofactor of APC complex)